MNMTVYLTIFMSFLFWQCGKDGDKKVTPVEIKQIDVLEFSIPGVDPKNITIKENLIVVYLPENYSSGNYIKLDVVFGTGYSSQSQLLNGVSFEGQDINLELENSTGERRTFNVIVIPFKAMQLNKPAQNHNLTIGPEVTIVTSFDLKGTRATVNDSGKVVYDPLVRFTDKTTGRIAQELCADQSYPNSGNEPTFTIPSSMLPGEYTAEIIWGTKTELLSHQVTVKPGAVQFKRGSWQMLGRSPVF